MAKPKVRIFKIHHKHEEEHAHGVWKVAFADFVTGMMAFFLLLWILNIAAEQNSSGFSIFYAPNNLSTALSGMGERDLGRDNTATQGQRISSRAISREVTTIPSFGQKSSTATTGVLIDQSSSIETGNNFMDNNTPIKTIDGKKRSQILQSIINRGRLSSRRFLISSRCSCIVGSPGRVGTSHFTASSRNVTQSSELKFSNFQ
ncbi:MAG: flagellar motor protein MotB [Pseudomonadota bacterium]